MTYWDRFGSDLDHETWVGNRDRKPDMPKAANPMSLEDAIEEVRRHCARALDARKAQQTDDPDGWRQRLWDQR